jgi:hypothetical protein
MRSLGFLFKVLWSPGEIMFLIARNPCFGLPLLLLIGSSLITGAVVLTKIPDLPLRAIEHSPNGVNISDETKDQLREQAASPATWIFTMVLSGVRPVLLVFIISGIYFLIFTLIGRQGSFKAFFSITTFSLIPTVFRQIVTMLSALLVPSSSIMPDELGSLSPAVFLDRDSVPPIVFAVVNMIDIVSIWTLSLMFIGFAFVIRKTISRRMRACVVIGVFLFYAVARVIIRII